MYYLEQFSLFKKNVPYRCLLQLNANLLVKSMVKNRRKEEKKKKEKKEELRIWTGNIILDVFSFSFFISKWIVCSGFVEIVRQQLLSCFFFFFLHPTPCTVHFFYYCLLFKEAIKSIKIKRSCKKNGQRLNRHSLQFLLPPFCKNTTTKQKL